MSHFAGTKTVATASPPSQAEARRQTVATASPPSQAEARRQSVATASPPSQAEAWRQSVATASPPSQAEAWRQTVATASPPSQAEAWRQTVATAPPPSQAITSRDGEDAVATSPRSRDGGDAVATGFPAPVFPGKHFEGGDYLTVSRGNALPHWAMNGAVYHICFRLADSVPDAKREEWKAEREAMLRQAVATASPPSQTITSRDGGDAVATKAAIAECNRLFSKKVQEYLDSGHGECILAKPGVGNIFIDVIRKGEGANYKLHAFGIMPNHVHVLVQIAHADALPYILQTWKSTSSHLINRKAGRRGILWQSDYYNHIVRTVAEYQRQRLYILGNDMVAAWCLDNPNVATASPPSHTEV